MPEARHSALLTDLYELTMAAAYHDNGFSATASFELFIRSLPPQRGYLVVAGLEQALDFLENLRFTPEQVAFLRQHPAFKHVTPGFFEALAGLRFTGEVWAMPEGTIAFAGEPLLRVTAPILEAQVVETFLLATLTSQTMVASKAARVTQAAEGRGVVEFGTRRAHGPEAGVLAARAAYIGGCIGTSNVEAGHRFGIPTFGTMAHSFVMAYADEIEAFRQFSRVFPERAVLLLDTYDTLAALDRIVQAGLRPQGVRLDSGDFVSLSREVRRRLDAAGLTATRIFASGDLNEYEIERLLAAGAALDLFGVGTELATSFDAPALGGVYKLVEVAGGRNPRFAAKFSPEKATYPGRKQVFRFRSPDGLYARDVVGLTSEAHNGAEPLLECVLRDGRRTAPAPPLEDARRRAADGLARLPAEHRSLRAPTTYPVRFSPALEELLDQLRREMQSAPAAREAD